MSLPVTPGGSYNAGGIRDFLVDVAADFADR
jgi:hypothetical protein